MEDCAKPIHGKWLIICIDRYTIACMPCPPRDRETIETFFLYQNLSHYHYNRICTTASDKNAGQQRSGTTKSGRIIIDPQHHPYRRSDGLSTRFTRTNFDMNNIWANNSPKAFDWNLVQADVAEPAFGVAQRLILVCAHTHTHARVGFWSSSESTH